MKSVFTMFVLVLLVTSGMAQVTLPHYDGLNYTVGQGLQSQTNWTSLNSGDNLQIASGNLSYTGMAASTGNKVTFDGTGIDASKAFTQQTSGTVYFSFLVNVTALGSLNTTGSYFAGFVEGATTNYGGTVWLRADGAGYDIGINPRTTAANTVWSSGTTSINGTHLVVIAYQIVASTGNDVAKMWIDPTWGNAEPAATLSATNTGTDLANVNRILIRQDAATTTPFVEMDEFRIGLNWQSVASTVNGSIGSGEYGTHTDGQNQNTNSSVVTYMNWDNNNLYVGVSGANTAEGYVLYLDKDPQIPVDGGSNSNGTTGGQGYDGTNFANLPFRADIVMYVKSGYREYRTSNGSNGWNTATTSFGLYSESGTVREFSIPWSVIGGRPAAFNWFSYNTSSGGFIYNTEPTENTGGSLGTSIRYERYFTVSTTTVGSSTPPFSRNSFVFNNTADENSFGVISVYDFTMNTSGRYISRTGATGSNWTIAGNMVVGNGTIYMGSGGTNGAYGSTTVSGDLDVRGGTLDMDQTTSPVTVNGNLSLSSGTLKLSGNGFGGGDLVLKGNWSNTGGTFTPSSRAVFLNAASGNQTITKSGGETFDYLIVDKAAGDVVLANDITVSQVLTLTNGLINTSSNKVILSSGSTSALARTNGYVNGNLQRAVATGTNTYLYAVGTATGYAPASFAFNSVGTGGNITVATADAAGPNYPSSLHATKKLGRYWSATNSGVAGYNTTSSSATFTYLTSPSDLLGGASSSNLKAYVYNGSTSYAVSNSNTSNSFTLNGFSDIGEFGAGECKGTLAPTFVKTMASSCGGGADGTITVTPAGGTSPYTYSWTSNPSGFTSTSAAITGLSPRDYTVVVTEATTCSATIQDITIWQALAPTMTHSGTSSSACGNTGSIIIYAANGVAPYTYSLDGVTYQAGSTFTDLAAGTYTLYVKDFGGCVSTKPNVVVSGASPIVVTSYATAASSCANNGSIQLFRTGGTGPYTYSLDDVTYQGSNVFTNLAGNTNYTGWVKDSKGCKSSLANIFVGKATAISVTQTHTNTSACANNGTISLTGAGGVPPYTYSITGAAGPYQSGNTFTGVAAGSYTAWIQDSKGCKANVGVTISSDAPIVVSATASDAGGCNNAGKIQLFRTGGVGPYTYSLDNVTYQASNTFTGLASGTYTGYVKDSKTCVGSLANITVTANTTALSVTAGSSPSSSCVNDGTIQLRPAGGVAPYTYSLDNITYQSGATFTGVAAGSYTGWVKDVNGCTASVSVNVAGNSITVTAYAVNASDCETSNGSIQLFRTGGTGPYTYSIDGTNYQSGNTFTNLTAGSYTGYVKDSKNCVGTLAGITVGPNDCIPPFASTKNGAVVKEKVNTVVKVQAFPNPSSSEFTLSLSGFATGKVSITIVDMLGRKVAYAETNNSQYRFGSNLKAGIYNVFVQQGNLKQSIKLVKE